MSYETLVVSWMTRLDPDVFRATTVEWEASIHIASVTEQAPIVRHNVWIRDNDDPIRHYDGTDPVPAWVPRPPEHWDASLQAYAGPRWDAILPTREGLPPGPVTG